MDLLNVPCLCDVSTVALILLLLCSVMYILKRKKPGNLPPGPAGLPILGYLPFLGKNPGETYTKLKEKHGPVMSVQVGGEYWIVLNDYDTIHEAFVKNGDVFSSRWKFLKTSKEEVGIVMREYGPVWKDLKKFSLQAFKRFGVDKRTMEDTIINESSFLLERLTAKDRCSLKTQLEMAVSNIISGVVFGSRFSYDDKTFLRLIKNVHNVYSNSLQSTLMGIIFLAPALRFLPLFSGALANSEKEHLDNIGIIKDDIKKHKESYTGDEPRDLIETYIKEMNERGGGDPSFNDKIFPKYINDLFHAGTETVSTTLSWAILCLAHHPKYQNIIFKEIEDCIGLNSPPSMTHMEKMPCTRAFIQEVLRHRTPVPMAILRVTTSYCSFRGFDIPKGTAVLPNLWAVHHDPNLFEDPEEFRPERFLDSEGLFVKSNHVIPFSIGQRSCFGDRLAKMELFLFLTTIIQKTRIVSDPAKLLPPLQEGSVNILVHVPTGYDVTFKKR